MPIFTYPEMLFAIDALNGVICTPETLGGNLWGWVPYASQNILKDVEPNVLLGKVGQLPPPELTDLHSKLEKFWETGTISDIRARMREVGLDSFIEGGL